MPQGSKCSRRHRRRSPGFLLALALWALSPGAAVLAGERLDCVYVPRTTADEPYPELTGFTDCAVREGDEVRIEPRHLAALDFGPDDLATMLIAGQWYYLRPDGTKMPVITWDNGPDDFSEGLARTVVDGQIAYLDRRFEIVVPPKYDWGWPFEDGVALVCLGCRPDKKPGEEHTPMVGGTWGYIDAEGDEVVPLQDSREQAGEELGKLRFR